ncbi:hypothetical protein ADICYQ_0654 [Cyclobacterium qasimii M12-11B]|uniref:Uncharacterized protein n=1 Tax=Cyclobacterium qasimii M12-11B TaxID=641524 RepID=S7X4P5_9BACT|nr:hypothetical protein ADICYQ_0654 [Cyclobacterium qasimii M12-11B]
MLFGVQKVETDSNFKKSYLTDKNQDNVDINTNNWYIEK